MLKKDDWIIIYEDPITEKKPEARMKLISKTSTQNTELDNGLGHLEFWLVETVDGEQLYRKIRVHNPETTRRELNETSANGGKVGASSRPHGV